MSTQKAINSIHGNCLIQHEVAYDKRGNAVGTRHRKHGKVISAIVHFYYHRTNGNTMCKTATGDIWEVKQVAHADYNFVTV